MKRVKSIADIINEVCAAEDKKQKIKILQENDHPGLRTFLQIMFDKNIQWELPEGSPPYEPNKLVDLEGIMYAEMRRFYLFWKGGNPNLSQRRREQLFVQLLESVKPVDAELLIAVKDKNIPKGINIKLVQSAFKGR